MATKEKTKVPRLKVKMQVEKEIVPEIISEVTPVIEMLPVQSSIDDIFFADVEKVRAKSIMPDFDFCSYNTHLIKVKLPHSEKAIIVNSVSENYLLLPNKDLFPKLEEEMKKFGDIQFKREIKNFGSFFSTYNFDTPANRSEIMKNDILIPRLVIQNSYNSTSLFKLNFGLFRLICENGLAIKQDLFNYDLQLSHCENNLDLIIENTLNAISEFLKQSKKISATFEPLIQRKVAISEIESTVDEILINTKSLLSYKKEIVSRILEENTVNGVELNMFSLYNGINYFLQPNNNSKMTSSLDIRSKTDQRVLDYIFDMAV